MSSSRQLQKAADAEADNPLAMIREAANLPQETYNDARIAAVVKSLPQDFRTPTKAIAYLERAASSDLNPLKDEIWAWEQGGDLQFMVSRDGWIKIADRDPKVEGLEFGIVYEGDEFSFTETGGTINVEHRGTMKKGGILGAFCVVHHQEGDHIERRLMEDFEHLHGKSVWRDNPDTMLLTRVISTAVRMKCPEAAGLHSEGEFAASDQGRSVRRATERKAGEATDDEADAIAAELAESAEEDIPEPSEDGGGREIEAEAKPADEGKASSDQEDSSSSPSTSKTSASTKDSDESSSEGTSSATPSTPSGDEPSTEDEGPEDPAETITCEICTEEIERSSYPGHKGGHSRSGLKLPEPVERIVEEEGGYAFVETETGEIRVGAAGPWDTWEDAVKAAQALDEQGYWDEEPEGEASEESTDSSTEPSTESDSESPDEDEVDDIEWGEAYQAVMRTSSEHPDGLRFVRSKANEVFEDQDVDRNDEGNVKTNELSARQLLDLNEAMKEDIENSDF